jgi:hypothetical protein
MFITHAISPGFGVANESYDVFVSYSRADWRQAADIDSALRANGLKSFLIAAILPRVYAGFRRWKRPSPQPRR